MLKFAKSLLQILNVESIYHLELLCGVLFFLNNKKDYLMLSFSRIEF